MVEMALAVETLAVEIALALAVEALAVEALAPVCWNG
jgi:hypothetical protein